MASQKLMRLELEMKTAEEFYLQARSEYRKQEVAECDHDWKDESFVNGHNGNEEVLFRCKACDTRTTKDPRT